MPATVVIPGVVRFAINAVWTNTRAITTVEHFRFFTPAAPSERAADCLTAAEVVAASWQTFCLPQIANNYVLQSVSFLDLNSADGASGSTPAVGAGGLAAEMLPPSICMLITKTAPGTRRQRPGRVFWPRLADSDVTEDGVVSAAVRAAVLGAYESYIGATLVDMVPLDVTGEPAHVIASWDRSIEDGIVNGTSRDIIDYSAPTVSSTQRRRVRG